jgi:ribosomal protein L29
MDLEKLRGFKRDQLDKQIDKWRDILGKQAVQAKSNLSTKAKKLKEVKKAVARYLADREALSEAAEASEQEPSAESTLVSQLPPDFELTYTPSF